MGRCRRRESVFEAGGCGLAMAGGAMTARTLAGCVTAPRPCGRDRGRRRAGRAVRFAAIAATIVGAGLAAGAAWGGENGLVVLPVEPNPQVIAVYPEYRWPIVKVVDGDTIKVDARADFPPELAMLHVRLRGVDTPEKGGRAKCEAERRAGQAATAFTAAAVADGRTVTFRNLAWDKDGGRVLADVSVDGRSLADRLIIAGHGHAYEGEHRFLPDSMDDPAARAEWGCGRRATTRPP